MLFGMSDNIVIAGDTPYSTSINSSFPSFPVVLVSKIEFSFTQILMVADCTHRVYPVSAFSLNFSMTASSGAAYHSLVITQQNYNDIFIRPNFQTKKYVILLKILFQASGFMFLCP